MKENEALHNNIIQHWKECCSKIKVSVMTLPFSKYLIIFLILAPIVCYFFIIFHYSINIPCDDDFDILSYLNHPDNIRHQYLFSQHNEHRIAFTRAITEISYYLFSELNFKYLVYIGNTALLIVFIILLHIYKIKYSNLFAFIPIPFLLFNPLPWQNMVWAVSSLPFNYVILFSLLALVCWQIRKPFTYLCSILSCIAATYTSGNGFIIFIILSMFELTYLLTYSDAVNIKKHKSIIPLIFLVVVGSIIGILYFKGLHIQHNQLNINNSLHKANSILVFWLILLGSYVHCIGKIGVLLAGILQLVIFTILTSKKYYRSNPVIYYSIVFYLASTAAMALGRYDSGLGSRYIIMSIMLFILEYMSILDITIESTTRKLLIYMFISIVLILDIASIGKTVRELPARQNYLIDTIEEWKATGTGLCYPAPEMASNIIKESIRNGSYKLPKNLDYFPIVKIIAAKQQRVKF